MISTEIASANKIMLGTTEAVAMYIGSTQVWSVGGSGQQEHDYSTETLSSGTTNGVPSGWTTQNYVES